MDWVLMQDDVSGLEVEDVSYFFHGQNFSFINIILGPSS